MGLNKYKLGELIELCDERNLNLEFGVKNVRGVEASGNFIDTRANMNGVDTSKYAIVRKDNFAYNPARINLGSISIYTDDTPCIVSPMYIVFKVIDTEKILPTYLEMFFKRKEFQRYTWFYAIGSVRDIFSFEDMCDIEIQLPPLEIQQRFVDIYNALVANAKSYEKGLEDLKLTCDAYIENLRRQIPCESIGQYITQKNDRNKDKSISFCMGLSTKKEFREPTIRVNKNELGDYKIVNVDDFAFVPANDTWKVLAFAYNTFKKPLVVSPIYVVFEINKNKLLPEYLAMWLKRTEFDRYARFHSWGSAREVFSFEDMTQVKIPIPKLEIQRSIVDIYNAYIKRKELCENLKAQIKAICPILIQGSLKEGTK